MANNSDGSIVLSVTIDTDDLRSETSKLKRQLENTFKSFKNISGNAKDINNELSKAVETQKEINVENNKQLIISEELKQVEAKTVQEQQKGLQEIANTEIAQERLTQSKLNSLKANNDLAISEEKVTQSINRTAISYEKVKQSAVGTEASNERLAQSVNNTIISSKKLNDIDGAIEQSDTRRAQAQENISSIVSEVSQKYDDVLQTINETVENANDLTKSQQELQQAVNETAISYEKIEQAVYNTAIIQEKLKQAANETDISDEKRQQAISKTLQEQQKELIYEEKLKQEKEKTIQQQEKSKQAQEKTTQEVIRTEKAQKSLENATSKITQSFKKMASSLGIVFGISEIIRFSNESSKLASSTEANVKRLGTLYGEAAQEVYDFANENAYAFGMAKSAAYDAAADYGNIFKTFADGKESAKLTNEMLQATAVIASQTGRTYEDVFEKIRSGLYGNTRAIDDLGLSVRKSSLMQTSAYKEISKNGTKSWNDLTDAELQNARALGIIEQASIQYGNTILQSSALVRSQFNAAWTDFKATFGQVINAVLIPIMQALSIILNEITSAIQSLLSLFGITLNISNETKKQVNNQKDLNDELDKTNKKLKDNLQGFDKINKLSADDSSSVETPNINLTETSGYNDTVISVDEKKLEDIKKKLEPILVLVSSIGGAFATWAIAKNFSKVSKILKDLSGLILIMAGAILLVSGYSEAWVNGIDWNNFALIMSGIALVVSGLLLSVGKTAGAVAAIGGGIAVIVLGCKDLIDNGANLKNVLAIISGMSTVFLGMMTMSGELSKGQLVGGLIAIAGAITAISGASDSFVNGVDWKNFAMILGGVATSVTAVAIATKSKMYTSITLVIGGIIMLISGMKDLVKKGANVKNMILVIAGTVATAVGLIITGVNPVLSIVLALVAAIGSLVIAIATEETAIMSVKKAQEKLTEAKEKAEEAENSYIDAVDNAESSLKKLKNAEKKSGISGKELYNQVKSGTLDYANMTSAQKEVYKAYVDNEKKQKDLKTATENLNSAKKAETIASYENQLSLAKESNSYDKFKKSVVDAFESGELSAEEARDLIGKSMSEMSDDSQQTFMEDLPSDIKGGLDPKQYETKKKQIKDFFSKTIGTATSAVKDTKKEIEKFWKEKISPWFTKSKWKELAEKCGEGLKTGFKNAINTIISFFEKMINGVIEKFNKISFTVPDWVPSIGGKTYGINIPKVTIPRLAQGAVIPANREFLAVLGDQKSGTNIEAPAKLIKQMAKEAINEANIDVGYGTIEVPVYIGEDVVFKAVVKQNQKYKKSLGVSPLGI